MAAICLRSSSASASALCNVTGLCTTTAVFGSNSRIWKHFAAESTSMISNASGKLCSITKSAKKVFLHELHLDLYLPETSQSLYALTCLCVLWPGAWQYLRLDVQQATISHTEVCATQAAICMHVIHRWLPNNWILHSMWSVHSSVGAWHIISVRCRRPHHADRSRSYCVRHPWHRLGLASVLRYWAYPADRRWIGEVSHVPVRVWRTSRLGLRTDPFWYVRVTYRRCHLPTQRSIPPICRWHAAICITQPNCCLLYTSPSPRD